MPHRRLSLLAGFLTRQQDSTIYELSGEIRLYTKDPSAVSVNADGPIGGPVLSLTGGARYSSSPDDATKGLGKVTITLPVTNILTLTGGYQFYEAIESSDITRSFGGVTFYTGRYSTGSQYTNPDGPPGFLAIRLSAGGSSRGYFGRAEFFLPLQQVTTLKLLMGVEKNDLLDRKSFQAGFSVSFYPLPE